MSALCLEDVHERIILKGDEVLVAGRVYIQETAWQYVRDWLGNLTRVLAPAST